MNLIRLFPLVLFLFSQSAWATSVFAGDDCVKCGHELPVSSERKVSTDETLLICGGFQAGSYVDSARANGIRIFGSVENFYSHMHQMQCPPNAPSPIYSGIYVAATADGYPQMFKDLAKLSPEVRARLLNRPTKGRRKETILDLIDRRIQNANGVEDIEDLLKNKREKFTELGAKKFSEMTPEELAVYE